jgi:hypothetical protein
VFLLCYTVYVRTLTTHPHHTNLAHKPAPRTSFPLRNGGKLTDSGAERVHEGTLGEGMRFTMFRNSIVREVTEVVVLFVVGVFPG